MTPLGFAVSPDQRGCLKGRGVVTKDWVKIWGGGFEP